MYPFGESEPPESWIQVLALPCILTLIACIVWFYGMRRGKQWKWISILPLAIAIYAGYLTVMKLNDPFYTDFLRGRDRLIMVHYVSPAVPLIALIGILAWFFVAKRQASYADF